MLSTLDSRRSCRIHQERTAKAIIRVKISLSLHSGRSMVLTWGWSWFDGTVEKLSVLQSVGESLRRIAYL